MEEIKSRREYRIEIVKFLYLVEAGGEYDKNEINEEVFKTTNEIIENNENIERIISSSLTGYTLKRLNLVDVAILKLCIFEMLYKGLEPQIAINEALEITKLFSDIDGKQVKFNNAVLDKAKKLIIDERSK